MLGGTPGAMDLKALVEMMCALDDNAANSLISNVLQSRPELAPGVVSVAVPDLTYAPAKALTERRSKGIVKGLDPQLGFGSIACAELGQVFGGDVYVHQKQLAGFQQGQEVSFAVVLTKENKPRAFDLQESQQSAAGGCGGCGASSGCGGCCGMGCMSPLHGPMGGAMGPGHAPMMGMTGGVGFVGHQRCKGGDGPNDGIISFGPIGGGTGRKRVRGDEQVLGEFVGKLSMFSVSNGFGLLACADIKERGYKDDVFLHRGDVDFAMDVGSTVKFECFLNSKGHPQARDLEAVPLPDPLGVCCGGGCGAAGARDAATGPQAMLTDGA